MPAKGFADAWLFRRSAILRYEESQILLKAGKTTGAVYLSGYGIECILKALVLISTPAAKRSEMLQSFRGSKAHDYEWLRYLYRLNGGARFPRSINEHFTLVNDGSTDLRYNPSTVDEPDAEAFLKAREAIIAWAKGRF